MKKGRQPLVSVIIPTHRHPEILTRAVISVLMQTYRNLEVIIINDGGYDLSLIGKTLEDSRIIILEHEVQKGPAISRNTGIKVSRGEYIAFLDDDDIYYPEHVETLVSILERGFYKVAYTDAHCVTQRRENGIWYDEKIDTPYSIDFSRERLFIHNYIPIITMMCEKALLLKVGLFDESMKSLEDWELFIRLSKETDFYHINKTTCRFHFRIGDDSHVNANLSTQMMGFLYAYNKHPVDNQVVIKGRIEILKKLKDAVLVSVGQN